MNLDQLTTSIETRRAAAARRQAAATESARSMVTRARRAGRAYLTPQEDALIDQLLTTRAAAADEVDGLDRHLAECHAAAADELRIGDAQRITRATGVPRPLADRTASLQVGRNERTYRPDLDPTGKQFLADAAANYLNRDPEAGARLSRHQAEERAERGPYMQRAAGDATTSSFVGLVVPQYLVDMFAPAVANLRPLADHVARHDLPESGMTVNISLVTTPSSVALQATELPAGNVSAQSLNDTLLTENVQVAAGQQTLSRQAIDRGTGIEDLAMQDLFRRYATALDSTMINQAVTGISAVAQATAYTDATPTQQELWPFLFQAQSLLEQALLGVAVPDYFVMHPRRWNWLTSALGATWPLISGQAMNGPQAAGLVLSNAYGDAVRGRFPNGMGVIVDANIPTNLGVGVNQDEIYCIASQEIHLWEDPQAPVYLRCEQPKAAQLGVLLVLYGYFAWSCRRYANNPGKIGGTGLTAPPGF